MSQEVSSQSRRCGGSTRTHEEEEEEEGARLDMTAATMVVPCRLPRSNLAPSNNNHETKKRKATSSMDEGITRINKKPRLAEDNKDDNNQDKATGDDKAGKTTTHGRNKNKNKNKKDKQTTTSKHKTENDNTSRNFVLFVSWNRRVGSWPLP